MIGTTENSNTTTDDDLSHCLPTMAGIAAAKDAERNPVLFEFDTSSPQKKERLVGAIKRRYVERKIAIDTFIHRPDYIALSGRLMYRQKP